MVKKIYIRRSDGVIGRYKVRNLENYNKVGKVDSKNVYERKTYVDRISKSKKYKLATTGQRRESISFYKKGKLENIDHTKMKNDIEKRVKQIKRLKAGYIAIYVQVKDEYGAKENVRIVSSFKSKRYIKKAYNEALRELTRRRSTKSPPFSDDVSITVKKVEYVLIPR